MSWCRVLDDEGRMWAMVNTLDNCSGGVKTISSVNFDGTLDLMVCAADTSVRFTTNGFCPSGFQELQTSLSVGGSDSSVPPSGQSTLTQTDVSLLFTAAASLYALVFIFKLSLKQMGY